MIQSCQNCKKEFSIDQEDLVFYERIEVPQPTWCPQCRFRRRLAQRNIFNLYHRTCDLCKKNMISQFSPAMKSPVYCTPCWWSDDWDAYSYGRDFDFNRPFFEQWQELHAVVPMPGMSTDLPTARTSPYTNDAGHLKNCYLVFFADPAEDCAYGFHLSRTKHTLDTSLSIECERMYDSRNTFKDNQCVGVENTNESIDSMFLRDSKNCQNCFASANVRSKKYYIFNQPYTREDYFKKINEWDLGSYRTYQEVKRLAHEHWKKFPPRPVYNVLSTDSTGNYVFESKNCKECYEVQGSQDSKYLHMILTPPVRDCHDITGWGNNLELSYECLAVGENASQMKFCLECGINAYDCQYSHLSTGGGHHFGCVAIKQGEYVIFNKRYDKAAFESLRARIIEHMKKTEEYGQFFPASLSNFGYNETLAQSFFPLDEDEAHMKGYRWHEPEEREYKIDLRADQVPDHISDTTDLILKQVIACEKCQRGYRVISAELQFLRQMRLPLPRRCPFCRIDEKFQQWIKQMRLVDRVCDTCKKEFKTPYSAADAPSILCKECWTEAYA